jgi:hypothetical protein
MHVFTGGFGFRLHSNFCFLSKVATTGPFLHLHFCFFPLSVQSLLFSFSCTPKLWANFCFLFSHLVLEKECIGCVAFEKSMGRCLFPRMLYGNFPKLFPLPSCKVFKTSTSHIETFQNTILLKLSLPCMTECMHCQSCTKTNRDALFIWRSALLANSGILRY